VAVNRGDFAKYIGIYWPFLAAGVLLCVPVFYNLLVWKRKNPLVIALLLVIFWVSVYFASISAGNPFMYFSF
jgi:alginate O-acetyltransferase complex protein AlgI